MTDTPNHLVPCTCGHCAGDHELHIGGGLGACEHCKCLTFTRATVPLTALTADQLRALALAGRKWIGADPEERIDPEEMAARLREEHDRLARQWAAELGHRDSLLFVDWEPIADRPARTRVIDLSEVPAGVLNPWGTVDRALALDTDDAPEVGP